MGQRPDVRRRRGLVARRPMETLELRQYYFVSADTVLANNPTFRSDLLASFTTSFQNDLNALIASGTYTGTYEERFDVSLKALMRTAPGTAPRSAGSASGLDGNFFVSLTGGDSVATRASAIVSADAANPNIDVATDKTNAGLYNYGTATNAGKFPDVSSGSYTDIGSVDWYQFNTGAPGNPIDNTKYDQTSLDRFDHWSGMARAYRYDTATTTYVETIAREMGDWADRVIPRDATSASDPSPNAWSYRDGSSGNTVTTYSDVASNNPGVERLDAVERARNFAWTYPLVLTSSKWTNAANTLFLYETLIHGRFFSNPTLSNASNGWGLDEENQNKQIMEAQSLLYLAYEFPEFSESSTWKAVAHDMVLTGQGGAGDTKGLIVSALYDDGGTKEQSATYQLKQVGDLLDIYKIDEINNPSSNPWDVVGSAASGTAHEMVRRADEFYYSMLQPDGRRHIYGESKRSGSFSINVFGDVVLGTSVAPKNYLYADDIWHVGTSAANTNTTAVVTGRNYSNANVASGSANSRLKALTGVWDSGNFNLRSGRTTDRTAITSTDNPLDDREVLFRGGDLDSTPDWNFTTTGFGPHISADVMSLDYYAYGAGAFPNPGGKNNDKAYERNMMTVKSSGTYSRSSDSPRLWDINTPNNKVTTRAVFENGTDRSEVTSDHSGGRDYTQVSAWSDEWKNVGSGGGGVPPSMSNSIVGRTVWMLNGAQDEANPSSALYGTTVVLDWGQSVDGSSQVFTTRFNTDATWTGGSGSSVSYASDTYSATVGGIGAKVQLVPVTGTTYTRSLEKTNIDGHNNAASNGDKTTFTVTQSGTSAVFAHVLTTWDTNGIAGVEDTAPTVTATWVNSSGPIYKLRIASGDAMWTVSFAKPNTDMTAAANVIPTIAYGAQIEAETFAKTKGLALQDGDTDLGSLDNGDYARFERVDLGTASNKITVRLSTGAWTSTKKIEVHLDSKSGTKIAEFNPSNTGSWSTYQTQVFNFLSGVTASGVHDIYLVGSSTATGIANVDWLQFGSTGPLRVAPGFGEATRAQSPFGSGDTVIGSKDDVLDRQTGGMLDDLT